MSSQGGLADAAGGSPSGGAGLTDDARAWLSAGVPPGGSPPGSAPPPPFGGAPPGGFEPPPTGPGTAKAAEAAVPDEGLARALRGGYPLRTAEWLTRGWSVFTREGGFFLAFGAIGWLLCAVTATVHLTWPLFFLGVPLLWAGFMTAALVTRRGERLQFSDFWLPFHDFLPLLLAFLVWGALLFAGLCTCGIVTVYLGVAYQFACLLILDRRMEFWDALESSRRVATKEWFGLFGFTLVLLLINVAGFLACTLGLIVTVPLTVCALVEAYADIFGVRGGLPGRRTAVPPAGIPAPPA